MAVVLTRPSMTAEELLQLPDDGYKYELREGELIRMAPTGARHGDIAAHLTQRLRNYVEACSLGVVCAAETGFRLRQNPDTVRAPDASFVARERVPPTGVPDDYWPFAPDLAVEVVSPNDRFDDVQTKVAEYVAAGTRLVWVVHPRTRTVLVYRSLKDVHVMGEGDELSGEDVVPGFTCRVGELFL